MKKYLCTMPNKRQLLLPVMATALFAGVLFLIALPWWGAASATTEEPAEKLRLEFVARLQANARMHAKKVEEEKFHSNKVDNVISGTGVTLFQYSLFPVAIGRQAYDSLDVEERIYHYLRYPEMVSQNCGGSPLLSLDYLQISANLDNGYFSIQSLRQRDGLIEHRSEVVRHVLRSLQENQAASGGMLSLILDLNIWESVPYLKVAYLKGRVPDAMYLTTMMRLMDQAQYAPWRSDVLYRELENRGSLAYNCMNVTTILYHTERFHAWKLGAGTTSI